MSINYQWEWKALPALSRYTWLSPGQKSNSPDLLTSFWWFWFLSWCEFLLSKGDGAGVNLGQSLQAFYRWIAGFYDTDETFHRAEGHLFLVIDSTRILIIRSRGGFHSRHKPRNLHVTAICSAITHFQSNHALQRSESEMPSSWIETMARKQ